MFNSFIICCMFVVKKQTNLWMLKNKKAQQDILLCEMFPLSTEQLMSNNVVVMHCLHLNKYHFIIYPLLLQSGLILSL